jgi:hypothetical protein
VLVAAAIPVASVVIPTVVPTVVPTALMHQNNAIATAATVLANSFPGDKSRFIIARAFLSSDQQASPSLTGV